MKKGAEDSLAFSIIKLITKNIATGEFEVTVRSSDFGTTVLENSRPVINSILVTKKYE